MVSLSLLYEKYRRLMYQVAFGVLGDSHLAEDAVHDAFIRISDHLDMVDDADSLRTKRLMVTVGKNTAIDIYRKRAKQLKREVVVEDYDECAEAVVYMEEEEELPKLITDLPPIYRDVFLLKYSSMYENSEISAILGIPEGTVRQRLARGKVMVEKAWKEMHEEG